MVDSLGGALEWDCCPVTVRFTVVQPFSTTPAGELEDWRITYIHHRVLHTRHHTLHHKHPLVQEEVQLLALLLQHLLQLHCDVAGTSMPAHLHSTWWSHPAHLLVMAKGHIECALWLATILQHALQGQQDPHHAVLVVDGSTAKDEGVPVLLHDLPKEGVQAVPPPLQVAGGHHVQVAGQHVGLPLGLGALNPQEDAVGVHIAPLHVRRLLEYQGEVLLEEGVELRQLLGAQVTLRPGDGVAAWRGRGWVEEVRQCTWRRWVS